MNSTANTHPPADEKPGTASGLKENSLKTAGWLYVIGDASFAAAKSIDGDKHGFSGAALWLAGGLAAGFFGNPKAEKQLQLLERRLGAYLKKQNVKIPENPTTHDLIKDGGIIGHIESFLYAYPSQMLNAAYAIGGALMVKGALNKKNTWDVAGAAIITAGALAGLLIPEKKPDPTHPAKGIPAKAWEWAQEKPLRVSGASYLINNVPMIFQAHQKYKAGSKSYLPRYLTVASYIFANCLLMSSSKDNLSAKNEQKNQESLGKLSQAAATVIAAQPKEVQEALVQNIAGYLSAQPEIKKTALEIAELLHTKLAETKQAQPVADKWQNRVEKGAEPQFSPSL